MSINRCNISGNIGRDPELRQTQGGTQVLTFSLAVSDRKRNQQSGEWEDVTNWIPCAVFGNRADALAKLLHKGMKVAIEGKLRWSQWEKDGQKRSKIEVIVDEVEFLSQRQQGNQQPAQPQKDYQPQYQPQQGNQQPPAADVYDEGFTSEDIPF